MLMLLRSVSVGQTTVPSHSRAPRWLRCTSLLMSVLFVWTALLAAPAQALAQTRSNAFAAPKPLPVPPLHDDPAWHTIDYHKVERALAGKGKLKPHASLRLPQKYLSLLDEAGHLAGNVNASEVAAWKQQLHRSQSLAPTAVAKLHVHIGEYELAQEDLQQAQWHFQQALRLSKRKENWHGLAAYDRAVTLYMEGAYQEAQSGFRNLLTAKPGLHGFDRRACALFLRHASACAGYHAGHAELGIPEPPRLDPLCGAAALAQSLKAAGKPYDKKTVLAVIHRTGRGSSLQDIIEAARKFGLSARIVHLDDKGLIALPKPLTCFTEHDHFVSVVSAGKKGISYLCSDCGPFPGGQIDLTWEQWHKMEPTHYAALYRHGSVGERALHQLAQQEAEKRQLLVTQLHKKADVQPANKTRSVEEPGTLTLLSLLRGHCGTVSPAAPAICGGKIEAQHCPHPACCPEDDNGAGEHIDFGPVLNDPVNLATGEEEYQPPADLSVYNPIGPSVSWRRLYNSLRGPNAGYQSDDYGVGWSHSYNVMVNQSGTPAYSIPQGSTVILASPTTPAIPTAFSDSTHPYSWEILLNDVSVASSSSPNGWTFTSVGSTASLAAPTNATVAQNYEFRGNVNFSGSQNAFWFDVVAPNSVPLVSSSSIDLQRTGTGNLVGAGRWSIYQNGTTIASGMGLGTSGGNGWTVNIPASNPMATDVMVTPGYSLGTGNCIIQWVNAGGSAFYANFTLILPHYVAVPGAKSILMKNGSTVPFTAPLMPLAHQQRVVCNVAAGYPEQVEWDYDPNGQSGHFLVTFSDRTQWTTATGTNHSTITHVLSQIADRNASLLKFRYGAEGPAAVPLLTGIADGHNSSLLTITRDPDTSAILHVDDRYSRSVYYQSSAYATQNVPYPFAQSYRLLDHVSQVVATGFSNPPDRFVHGYQNVVNGDGGETIPFLHTITVPSPTGSGTVTGTLNYNPSLCTLSSIVDANNNSHVYTYPDASHTKVTVQDSLGNTVYSHTVGFDLNMSVTSATDGTNSTIIHAAGYGDPNNPFRPSQIQDGNGYAAGGVNNKGTWTYTWDNYGHCLTATTPRNTTTTCTWDYSHFALGELTAVHQGGKAPVTVSYYEPSGLPNTVHFPTPGTAGGMTTVPISFTYNPLGDLLTLTVPGNNAAQTITETYSYAQNPAIGQPLTITNNLGKATHIQYDTQGRPISLSDSLNNAVQVAYNIVGQPTQLTFPATGQTGTGQAAEQMSYLYPEGPLTLTSLYDESGNLFRHVAPVYGPEGEVKAATGDVSSQSVTYDAAYRVKQFTDGAAHSTAYAFNTAGYLQNVTLANGDSLQLTSYDANGNLLSRKDGRNVQTSYVYNDPESLLTSVPYASSPLLNVTAGYDGYGRPNSLFDGTGSRSWTYDDLDFLSAATTTYTGLPTQTLAYSYYPNGQESGLTTPGGNFAYYYDADGRPSSLTNPQGLSFGWLWLDNDWLWKQTSNNAVVTTFTYNAMGQVTDLKNQQNNMAQTLLSEFGSVTYNGAGDCLSLLNTVTGLPAFSGTSAFSYDNKSRLTNESDQRQGGWNYGFGYDGANNLTAFAGATRTFNSVNENQSLGNVYDGEGNPTTYRGSTLSWDAEDRLSSVGTQMSAGYSGTQRVWQQTAAGQTYYLYDGSLPVCELDNTGAVQAIETWGANGLLARSTKAGSSFTSVLYAFDLSGNTSQRLDSSGNVLETLLCSAWGSLQSNNPSTDPYRGMGAQSGVQVDSSGLYFLPDGRYYDAAVGQVLSRNPGGGSGGNGYSLFGLNSAPNPTDGAPASTSDPLLDRLLGIMPVAASNPGNETSGSNDRSVASSSGENASSRNVEAASSRSVEDVPASALSSLARGLCFDPNGVDDGDPANTYIPSSGLDEIRHAGGGRRGLGMARPFFNSLVEAIPGGGLVPAITGRDTFGCEVGGWGRVLSGVNGILTLLGVAGHFAGPATEAAAATATTAGTFDKDLALGLANHGNRSPWGEMQTYLHLKNGAGTYYTFSNPAEYAIEMDRAGSIHFNLHGFEPGRAGGQWTQKEWDYLLNNPALHSKSTVYNPLPGVQIPPTIRIGPSFPPYPRR